MTPEEIYAQLTAGAPRKRTKGYAKLGDGTFLKWIIANPTQALQLIAAIVAIVPKQAAPEADPASDPAA